MKIERRRGGAGIGSLLAIVVAGCAATTSSAPAPSVPSQPATPSAASSSTASPIPTTAASSAPSSSLALLPAHGRIAFNLASGPTGNISTNIDTIEPDGTGLVEVTHLTAGCERDPAWTPSGDRMVLGVGLPARAGCDDSTSQYVASMDSSGGSIQRLTTVSRGIFDDSPVVSPDGKRIAFSRFDVSGRLTGIWIMNADGGQLRRVTSTPRAFSAGGDQSPAFSPDGTKLVFARDRGDNAQGALEIVGVDGHGLREIVPESVDPAGPHWSPDGSKIVFGSLDTASAAIGHNIHVVNADGSGLASLTDETSPSGDGGPTWSPDGTRITFTQYHAGEHFVSVVVMNADGSDPVVIWHPISGTDNFPGSPAWGTAP